MGLLETETTQLKALGKYNYNFYCLANWRKTQGKLNGYTNYVDFYNILKFRTFDMYSRKYKNVKPFGKIQLGKRSSPSS